MLASIESMLESETHEVETSNYNMHSNNYLEIS